MFLSNIFAIQEYHLEGFHETALIIIEIALDFGDFACNN